MEPIGPMSKNIEKTELKTMKKVVMQGKGEPLVFTEGEIPTPGKGQLLLKVKACGICGSDLHWVNLGLARPGSVLGHEFFR